VEPPPLAAAVAKATGAQQDRAGRLLCGKDLSLPGHPDILVTGDMMSLDKLPGVAEVAMQTGLYAGRRISHESQGQTYDKPFRCQDLGSAAYISRGRAVVSVFKIQDALRRLPGLGGLAFHPHRLPHRLPQPHRSDVQLVVRVHP
jgi:NADH dehydrogenase